MAKYDKLSHRALLRLKTAQQRPRRGARASKRTATVKPWPSLKDGAQKIDTARAGWSKLFQHRSIAAPLSCVLHSARCCRARQILV